nr:FAD-dependent oxidoreductase [Marinibactrum halimedae]
MNPTESPSLSRKRIAIVGSGISGLASAYYLHKEHDITLFEAESRLGGHTATVDVSVNGEDYAIDTGFIVFNDWTYPLFKQLLAEIGVAYQPTSMGFSVSCQLSGLEYSGENLKTLFAQKRNIFSLKHWGMLRDIVRFNRESVEAFVAGQLPPEMTVKEYLKVNHYGRRFSEHYLVPMAAAIWSKSSQAVYDMPIHFFVQFFKNHGLLSVNDRPQWHVIKGGSRSYIEPLTRGFQHQIRLSSPVQRIIRHQDGVTLEYASTASPSSQLKREEFDEVILACHSNTALRLLGDPTEKERSILGAIEYQDNEVVLHTDTALLPKRKSVWSSWNYLLTKDYTSADFSQSRAVLTYDMNILQGIDSDNTFCVTLNHTDAIDPRKILGTFHYAHPVFTLDAIAAQQQWHEINGVNKTWFCGAYWRNGFHEDGVFSAKRVSDVILRGLSSHLSLKPDPLKHSSIVEMESL